MNKYQGFTLLELIIVMVIAAVLVTLAIPSLRNLQLASERSEASTSLYGAFVTARSEAVSRNTNVNVCTRDTTSSCGFPQCAATGAWTGGWVVYRGSSAMTGCSTSDQASVIAAGDPTDSSFSATASPSGTSTEQFTGSGRANSALTITLAQSGNTSYAVRCIRVDLNGRVSLSVPPTGTSNTCP